MNRILITVKAIASADGMQWLVLATLDPAHPQAERCHLAVSTRSESQALGVASDLLAAASQSRANPAEA